MIINFRQALCGAFRDPAARARDTLARGWQARGDVAPWPIGSPIDWLADPFDDRNWRFLLNAWRPLDALITAHSQTREPAFLAETVRVMTDWAAFEAEHPDQPLLWNDMGSGLRAAKLAYVLTQPEFADEAFDAARQGIADLARRHMARLRDRSFIGDSNHGLFQVHGVMALARALPLAPESRGAEAYAKAVFTDLLRLQFSEDGVHLEHSPGYHVFALKTVERFLASGWYDDMVEVRRLIALVRGNLAWFVFPDGRLSAAGDSSRAPIRLPPPRPSERTIGRLYRHGGYAVVRSGRAAPAERASMLLVTGAHHSNVHKHADELSFELYSRGRHVIVDTGKYTYSRKSWREFTDSAAAHNSVDLIAERSDNGVRKTAPAGSVLSHMAKETWGWVIEGAVVRPEWGVRHARTFLYRPGQWLVLLDHIESHDAREVTAWLHLDPSLEAARHGPGWRFEGRSIRYSASTPFALHRHRGETEPRIQGWVADAYHQRQPNDALGLSAIGSSIRLATTLVLDETLEAPEAAVADGRFLVRWRGAELSTDRSTTHAAPSRSFFRGADGD